MLSVVFKQKINSVTIHIAAKCPSPLDSLSNAIDKGFISDEPHYYNFLLYISSITTKRTK